jgi:HK97 family phage prohead protease
VTGGEAAHPGDTERLHEYWVHGEGAAKIRWGEPNDFARCVEHLGKYIADPQGYCNLAHKAALGIYPATHAAEIKKATGRSSVTTTQRAAMATADINDLPDDAFAYIQPGGKKDASGKTIPRSLRHFPVHDAAHVRNALAQVPKSPFGDKAMPKIKSAAKRLGVDVSSDSNSNSRAEYMRLYPLEDIHILRSADGGDGRTVEAFAAVFDDPAEIQDFEGHYVETIDRAAFNKVIADASRARGGFPGSVKVLYNHGMTLQGTPSERFSMPIGVPVDIRAEQRGLLTRTRYSETALAEEILESIRAGSITSQSFTGRIVRSDPQLRRGDRHRPDSTGNLRTVRRTELGLREYGPVLWPAYSGAEILGVRMSTPGEFTPEPDDDEQALPPDEGAAAGEPPAGDSTALKRHHQNALYRLKSAEIREKVGLVWLSDRKERSPWPLCRTSSTNRRGSSRNSSEWRIPTRPPRRTTGTCGTPSSPGGRNSTRRPRRSSSGWSASRPSPASPTTRPTWNARPAPPRTAPTGTAPTAPVPTW